MVTEALFLKLVEVHENKVGFEQKDIWKFNFPHFSSDYHNLTKFYVLMARLMPDAVSGQKIFCRIKDVAEVMHYKTRFVHILCERHDFHISHILNCANFICR